MMSRQRDSQLPMSSEPPLLARQDGERRIANRTASVKANPMTDLQDEGNGLPHTLRTTRRHMRFEWRCPSALAALMSRKRS
jgi:hypothetical protein